MYRRAAAFTLLLLSGCTSMNVTDFAAGTPEMRLESYFPGAAEAHGMFLDRFGNVRNQFSVAIHSEWDGKTLTMHEHFTYVGGAHGQLVDRVWHFHKAGDHRWIGTATDVIGEAHGRWSGNAFHMRYTVDLPVGKSRWRVQFSDWLFRESPRVVLNHAVVSRFGITIGQVQLAFRHQSAPPSS